MQYTGTVIGISETVFISERFAKREFVLSDKEEQFPQTILFEFHQNDCDLLDYVNEGDIVKVDFRLRGRQHTKDDITRTYNALVAYKIEKIKY